MDLDQHFIQWIETFAMANQIETSGKEENIIIISLKNKHWLAYVISLVVFIFGFSLDTIHTEFLCNFLL